MSACATVTANLNALRHGGASKSLIIRGENRADFEALLQGLVHEYQPDTEQSRLFVEYVAEAHWLLARRQRAHNAIESAIYAEEPDPAEWTEHHLKRLALADRYKTQAERALKRALNNLDGWRKWNRSEAERNRRATQWNAEHSLRERRVAVQEQKLAASQTPSAASPLRFAKNAFCSPDASTSESQIETLGQATGVQDACNQSTSARETGPIDIR